MMRTQEREFATLSLTLLIAKRWRQYICSMASVVNHKCDFLFDIQPSEFVSYDCEALAQWIETLQDLDGRSSGIRDLYRYSKADPTEDMCSFQILPSFGGIASV